jgi:hypothetical protein
VRYKKIDRNVGTDITSHGMITIHFCTLTDFSKIAAVTTLFSLAIPEVFFILRTPTLKISYNENENARKRRILNNSTNLLGPKMYVRNITIEEMPIISINEY